MTDRQPRPSTEDEHAPLLRDPEAEEVTSERPEPTLGERLNGMAHEPLTPLTKILLILVLIFLILSSIFIGLFIGVQHKLNVERDRDRDEKPPVTATYTATATTTSVATTTAPLPGPSSPPEEPVCLDASCIQLSASILSSLDTSQDPCENFYDYANGGWLKSHPLPADKSSFGPFSALAVQNKQIIQRILEEESTTASFDSSWDDQLLGKLRGFYSSCMDEDKLDEIGTEPLIHFVNNVRSLYRGNRTEVKASAEEYKKAKVDGLTAALAFLHSRDVDTLFTFDIEGDVGVDPNHMTLWFSQPSLGLPSKEYYKEKSILKVYRNVLERLLVTLVKEEESLRSRSPSSLLVQADGIFSWPPWPWPPWGEDDDGGDGDDGSKKPTDPVKRAHKLAKKVVKFESKLADITLDLDELYGDPFGTYNPASLENLTSTLPQIDFPRYFSTFTPRAYPSKVIMTNTEFPKALSKLLDDTDEDVLEAYLVARAALDLSPYLGKSTEAWQAQRALVEELTGVKKGAYGDRSEYCVGQVEYALGFAAGRYFVNETFGGESREKGTKVITDIVKAFQHSLPNIEWMDKKSAKAATEKAAAIRVKVGFPLSPDTRDPRSLVRYYNLVKGDKDKFFDNVLSAATSDKFKAWLQLEKERDKESWEMYPSIVNAYFNPPANEIVFPAGILQPPFFSKGWPAYLMYGAFGHVAAHELTHAFDSSGRLYNQQGKLESWWTNATSDGFNEKQDCIVKQYSSYTIDDGKGNKVHVNGNLTSGENIGDTGLIQAYRAWKAQYDDSAKAGNEYILPGLNYTREQLFFIGFGQIWAQNIKPQALLQRVRTDPHSPNNYRVDGTVYNIPEFAKAFNCSKGAKLNPPAEKQCRFW